MLDWRVLTFLTLGFLTLGATLAACGGGGGSSSTLPSPQWSQFRNDSTRTGGFGGSLLLNRGAVRFAAVDDGDVLSPVLASAAVGADGTIYASSSGGTLKALSGEDLAPRWSVTECAACCPPTAPATCSPRLGAMISSPAIFRSVDAETSVAVADLAGRVYLYTFIEEDELPEPVCVACFAPDLSADLGPGASASFRSSPTFTFNAATGTLASILIGAELRNSADTAPSAGKLYAINSDGTLRWQYPARGRGVVGPITSSPSLGLGQSVVFPDANDQIHILTRDGVLRRQISVTGLSSQDAFLQATIVSSASLLVGTALGDVYAFNHDGTFRWSTRLEGRRFLGSLAVGIKADPTPTSAPTDGLTGTATPTPTLDPNEPTPTPTVTPTTSTEFSTVMGVASDGEVLYLDSSNGALVQASAPAAALEEGASVVGSPAISFDALLAYASSDGSIFNIDSGSGSPPRFCIGDSDTLCTSDEDCLEDGVCDEPVWPVRIPRRCSGGASRGEICLDAGDCPGGDCVRSSIHSSPSLDDRGNIIVGADDGYLYVIGATGTPARSPTPTPSPAATTAP